MIVKDEKEQFVTPQPSKLEATDSVIRLSGIEKSFGDTKVLLGIDLAIRAGEHVSVVGPSGSGKSTLLRCMNLFERPSAGQVEIDGEVAYQAGRRRSDRQLVKVRQKVGMVFQSFNLFPHLTAIDNVTLGLIRGLHCEEREALERGIALLQKVGLGDKLLSFPSELSGGQQQRVAIARALALQPVAILFDEPTSALDPELVGEVLAVMREIADEGMTMVIVTHELRFAAEVSNRVVFLDRGSILEEGPPSQVLKNPHHERTREFISKMVNY